MKKSDRNCPHCGAVLGEPDANGRIQCEYCDSVFSAPVKLRAPMPVQPTAAGQKSKGIFAVLLIPLIFLMVFGMIGVTVFSIIRKQNDRFDEPWDDVSSLSVWGSQDGSFDIGAAQDSSIAESMSQFDIEMYNIIYETYSGTEYGSTVGYLLEEVVTNNKTNPAHLLTVRCGELCTTEEDEITQFKHTLDRFGRYEVSLEYDNVGLVYEIEIQALPDQK